MVDDEVDNDAYAALMAAVREFNEVAKSAIALIDAVVVRNVVSIVLAGRGLKRHEPNRRDAEAVQVVETPRETAKVAYTIAVGVHETSDG